MSKTPERGLLHDLIANSELLSLAPDIYLVAKNSESLPARNHRALVVSGPTGAGKDTIKDLLPTTHFTSFKTCTTRPRRPTEPEGEKDPYHRLTPEEFALQLSQGCFFESNVFNGHFYGGRVSDVEAIQKENKIPIFRIDPKGMQSYLRLSDQSTPPFTDTSLLSVFVVPPTIECLANRLYTRDVAPYTDSPDHHALLEVYHQRLEIARTEIGMMLDSHLVLVNRDGQANQIISDLVGIILSHS